MIVSFGEVLWDLFPEGARFGGAPANFACHAAALGAEVVMVSAVGNDARGRQAIEILKGYGIDVSLVRTLAGVPTGAVSVSLDNQGKPTYSIEENVAWDRLCWSPELESRIAAADAAYFGTLGQRAGASRQTIRHALDTAAAAGVVRILDVNLRPPFYDAALIRDSVERASVLKLSDDELETVAAACAVALQSDSETTLASLLARFSLDLVTMTRGGGGALLVSPERTIDQPGIPVDVRDTVGAGDSFTAALVTGLLAGEALESIALNACQLAAAVCAQSGAVPEHAVSSQDEE